MRKLFNLHNIEMGFCLAVMIALPFSISYALFKMLGVYIFVIPASIILFSIIGFAYNFFRSVKK
jgi:hypothetical protein